MKKFLVVLTFVFFTAGALSAGQYIWKYETFATEQGVCDFLGTLEDWQVPLVKVHSWNWLVYVSYPVKH